MLFLSFYPLESTTTTTLIPGRPTWQQTMLRISDPEKTIPFYTDIMGMTLIDTLDFPQYDFKLLFLTTLPKGEVYDLVPGTQEAHVCCTLYIIFLKLFRLNYVKSIYITA